MKEERSSSRLVSKISIESCVSVGTTYRCDPKMFTFIGMLLKGVTIRSPYDTIRIAVQCV
ncbi:hypothetical protein DPMN_189345 [Dreissena polymorpha]|uniref:Uncharacterized protein n=1 Tax=Dreissena polymorpha TaxID=45954 RepID=A0A9D4DSC8_DREPO|nr:hypothetical protein DPMN_189345 [Dreissena polymorpha]